MQAETRANLDTYSIVDRKDRSEIAFIAEIRSGRE